jgi:serine protease Do
MIRYAGGKAGLYALILLLGMILGAITGGEIIRRIYANGTISAQQPPKPATSTDPLAVSSLRETASAADIDDIHVSRHNAIVRATNKIAPCVVGIVVTQVQVVRSSYYLGDFMDLFFAPELIPREVENMGSGFLISADGLILTNYHVVQGAQKLIVNLPGREQEGKIVGVDPKADLALVKIEGSGYAYVNLGDSDSLLIGEWAVAIGNPFGYFINDVHPSVTVGVISALNRNFAPNEGSVYQNMIQTDAAINPGNSGGPLLNAAGEVVGINTFIFTGSKVAKGSIGIGFAIPINHAKRVVKELMTYGKRRSVWTGISVQDIDRQIAQALGYERASGVVITFVEKKSPGEIAGLQASDIIVRIGHTTISSSADLEGSFLDYYVGDRVDIDFVRKGKPLHTSLALKEAPGSR